jgi:spermidine synthase
VGSSIPGFQPGPWLAEAPLNGYQQGFRIEREVADTRSEFQTIAVVDTEMLGRMLVLEGTAQTTTVDEHIYHEMLVHPALTTARRGERGLAVLIIGGGDGGALRTVLSHEVVRRAVQVEIDGLVVDICNQYLPEISGGAYQNPRAELIIGDGARFLAETNERFDAVLIDSTDPVGPAEVLFGREFYRNVFRVLNPGGVVVSQSGSPLLMGPELGRAHSRLKDVFPVVRPYLASIPSYPGVIWSFLAAAKQTDPAKAPLSRIEQRMAGIETKYYTPEVHRAAFALPAWLARTLQSGSENDVGLLPLRTAVPR